MQKDWVLQWVNLQLLCDTYGHLIPTVFLCSILPHIICIRKERQVYISHSSGKPMGRVFSIVFPWNVRIPHYFHTEERQVKYPLVWNTYGHPIPIVFHTKLSLHEHKNLYSFHYSFHILHFTKLDTISVPYHGLARYGLLFTMSNPYFYFGKRINLLSIYFSLCFLLWFVPAFFIWVMFHPCFLFLRRQRMHSNKIQLLYCQLVLSKLQEACLPSSV